MKSLSTLLFWFAGLVLYAQIPPDPSSWKCPDPSSGTNLDRQIRGLYVDELLPALDLYNYTFYKDMIFRKKGILGNRENEEALLYYAQLHDFTYLVLFDVKKIFEKSFEDFYPKRQQLLSQLNDFIARANDLGIEVGLAFEPEHIIRSEDYENPNQNIVVTQPEINPADILALCGDLPKRDRDSLFAVLEKRGPGSGFYKEAYAMAAIDQFNRTFKKTYKPQAKRKGNRDFTVGIKSVVTEYEWWNMADREPESIGKWSLNGPDNIFKVFVDFMKLMHAFAGNSHGKDIAFHVYQGPMPTVSKRFRKDPNIETVEDYYNDIEDVQPDDDYPYWENWLAQIVYFADRIFMTNHYRPHEIDLIYQSKQSIHQSLIILRETRSKREEYGDDYEMEIASMFSAETNRYVNSDEAGRHKGNLWGDRVNSGPSNGGESIYKLEERYKDFWGYDKNDNGEIEEWETYEREFLHFVGSQWFSYSVMPHMVYSMQNPFHSKYRLSSHNIDGITGERFNYYPSKKKEFIYLEVHNPDRIITKLGAPQDLNTAGNIYEWNEVKLKPNQENYGFSHEKMIPIPDNANPVLRVWNFPEQRYFMVSSTDEMGCKTYSVPVKVIFRDSSLYIRDEKDYPNPWVEPYEGANPWQSPDIWVNQEPDHNTAKGAEPGEIIKGYENYIHVSVHNPSAEPSLGSEYLELYFSRVDHYSVWPERWLKYYPNADTLLGDRAHNTLVPIPVIPPFSDTTLSIKWENLPHIDTSLTSDSLGYLQNRRFGVLARILRSENGPTYGMSFPEGTEMLQNVRNNNTIALHEVMVIDSSEIVKTPSGLVWVGQKSKNIYLYPNPAKEAFAIEIPPYSGEMSVEIINTLGQMVFQKGVVVGKNTITPQKELTPGYYTVIVVTRGGQVLYRSKLLFTGG
ncbi:T9SS type A sorting domain-containing protein [Luteibaculum oceani]|uniref:T9SS type A sorting domain-containing protein n=1 Tax=Luteibaculum oceani TaxID=1294296 RepID=A0A5C6UYV4_9FLAO|nr:T9SS type A sorting domain-containing protein [Luteibaculum oceani]TXC78663.1 T9SS type A sorting domain-containing protein [Luteibaculum oceani]